MRIKGNSGFLGRRGFTLLEVMIALVILSIGLLGLAGLQIVATRSNSFSNQMTVGITLAQDKLEELRNLSYDDAQLNDPQPGNDSVNGNYQDGNNPIRALGDMGFNRSWTVSEDATNNLKTITVTVQWPHPDNSHSVSFTTVKSQ